PLTRVALGAVAGGTAGKRGAVDTGKGYLALGVGAAAVWFVLVASGYELGQSEGSYLLPVALQSYWSSLSVPSLAVSVLAAAAGATLIAINRTVLTAGAMIGLGLIPSAALGVAALLAGDGSTALGALTRFAVDAVIVFAVSA